MTDIREQKPVEVETTKEVKGKVVYGGAALNLPAPATLARWMNAVKYFCATSIVTVSASDLFPEKTSKAIALVLALIIIGAGAAKLAVGVDTEQK